MNDEAQVVSSAGVRLRSKFLDYIELMKPELTSLSVLTALCGFYLGSTSFRPLEFVWVGLGTLLLGGGAGTLNQYLERNYDATMRRTERRPLPAGRLLPGQAFVFGCILSGAGLMVLLTGTNLLTATLGFATISSYLLLYTPLKRMTSASTLVGAIPGALPPVMGWTAAANSVDTGAVLLFAILFFWQMPHFLSLAWMYRKDYARAGYKMITVSDDRGTRTGSHIVLHTIILLPVSIATSFVGMTGLMYGLGAFLLGIGFLIFSFLFLKFTLHSGPAAAAKVNQYSRQLFFASLLYLPALMFLMTVDKS